MPPSQRDKSFVEFLEKLRDQENRAALAALRRALGKPPGHAPEAYPYVVPFLGAETSLNDEAALYLVAALFAAHQISWPDEALPPYLTNLGASMRSAMDQSNSAGVERRFVGLLKASIEDLPEHLRHAVSLLKSKSVPIDWTQLLDDLRDWERDNRRVQRRWARAFWGESPPGAMKDSAVESASSENQPEEED